MPQFVEGNHTFFAWCKRPGCPMACYRAVAVGSNLEAQQVWEPEHERMTAAPKTVAIIEVAVMVDVPARRTC